MNYLSYLSFLPRPRKAVGSSKPFSYQETAFLAACNALIVSMEEEFLATGLLFESSQLNRFVSDDGRHGVLGGKDYQCNDMVFPFIAGYVERETAYEEEPKLTVTKTLYCDLVGDLGSDRRLRKINDEQIAWLRKMFQEFKTSLAVLFKDHCTSGIFKMNFHTLEHLCDDLSKVQNISFLDAASCEHFNTF